MRGGLPQNAHCNKMQHNATMAKFKIRAVLGPYAKGGINIPESMQNARKGPLGARNGLIAEKRGRFFVVRSRFSALFTSFGAPFPAFIYRNSFLCKTFHFYMAETAVL